MAVLPLWPSPRGDRFAVYDGADGEAILLDVYRVADGTLEQRVPVPKSSRVSRNAWYYPVWSGSGDRLATATFDPHGIWDESEAAP